MPYVVVWTHLVTLISLSFTETRQAVAKLLAMTSDPKSGEIRRCSQKAIIGLFDLNPATFTLMLRSVSKPLQESANRILRSYMQVSLSLSLSPPTSVIYSFTLACNNIIATSLLHACDMYLVAMNVCL